MKHHFDGLVQDCSNSISNALELLQSCTKPSIYDRNTNIIQQDDPFNFIIVMIT